MNATMSRSNPDVLSLNGRGNKQLNLDLLMLNKSAKVIRAVNHKLRQQIIKYLNTHNEKTVT